MLDGVDRNNARFDGGRRRAEDGAPKVVRKAEPELPFSLAVTG
jgi:hypothetical protein